MRVQATCTARDYTPQHGAPARARLRDVRVDRPARRLAAAVVALGVLEPRPRADQVVVHLAPEAPSDRSTRALAISVESEVRHLDSPSKNVPGPFVREVRAGIHASTPFRIHLSQSARSIRAHSPRNTHRGRPCQECAVCLGKHGCISSAPESRPASRRPDSPCASTLRYLPGEALPVAIQAGGPKTCTAPCAVPLPGRVSIQFRTRRKQRAWVRVFLKSRRILQSPGCVPQEESGKWSQATRQPTPSS